MASFVKFNPFIEAVFEKAHNMGSDQLTVFLTTHANIPTATMAALSEVTPISYTNLSSRNLTTSTSAQTSGTYKLVIADLTLTASGGAVATFRHVGIYNDTSTTDLLVSRFDYGSDLTLADGESLTLDFDATAGLMQAA